jgi:hypothetical protein
VTAPYQIERLHSDMTITVSRKEPVTAGSAGATAREGRSRPTCSLLLQVERIVLTALAKEMPAA